MTNRIQRYLLYPWLLAGLIFSLLITGAAFAATAPELADNHPDRYTVKKGDTLWDIAGKFLRLPWRWPQIWQDNQQIENPHLIYPGDVLVLTYVDGNPRLKLLRNNIVRLSPKVRSQPVREAIPAIEPGVIQAFLRDPLVLDEGMLKRAGYVAAGLDDRIAFGRLNKFYGRGLKKPAQEHYSIFRPDKILVDPITKEKLGQLVLHLGSAIPVRENDDTVKMEIIKSHEEILAGDRLLPTQRNIELPYFLPHAPDNKVEGNIINIPHGVSEVGTYSVVVINLGKRNKLEPGHVLRIMRQAKSIIDPVTKKPFTPPLEDSGLLMVFRSFEKVSFGLVMSATRPIHLNDHIETP